MPLKRDEILLLFDVDGTLTPPRATIEQHIEKFIYSKIKPVATIGIIGGSDLEKMFEQLNGKKILQEFDYVFPENGTVQIKNGVEIGKQCLQQYLGEDVLQRGTFLEFRNGMMNICPMGRQCSREERNAFHLYNKEHRVIEAMIDVLRKEFVGVDLVYSIGGQISFDVFPSGWDKTYCLRHVTNGTNFKEIHFFGDKTEPGGNDYEIFIDQRTISHKVTSPNDTKAILEEIFAL